MQQPARRAIFEFVDNLVDDSPMHADILHLLPSGDLSAQDSSFLLNEHEQSELEGFEGNGMPMMPEDWI
jgi:hypothetical protein